MVSGLWSDQHVPRSAILIAGGFHTEGLTERLKERGISYVLVTPKIGSMPEKIPYREQMRGEVSWKEYFRVENGKVNLYKAFVRAVRDKLLNAGAAPRGRPVLESGQAQGPAPTLLKSWRDQIIRDLAEQGQISKAGRYTRFLDEVGQKNKTFAPNWFLKVERFIENLRGLEAKGELTEQNILNLLNHATISPVAVSAASAPRAKVRVRFINGYTGPSPEVRAEKVGSSKLEVGRDVSSNLELQTSNFGEASLFRSEVRNYDEIVEQWIQDKEGMAQVTADDGTLFEFKYKNEGEDDRFLGDRQRLTVHHQGRKIGYVHFRTHHQTATMYVAFRLEEFSGLREAETRAIFVQEDLREKYKGVGRTLMGFALAIAAAFGVKKFVALDVQAEKFFKDLGFEFWRTRGEEKDYYFLFRSPLPAIEIRNVSPTEALVAGITGGRSEVRLPASPEPQRGEPQSGGEPSGSSAEKAVAEVRAEQQERGKREGEERKSLSLLDQDEILVAGDTGSAQVVQNDKNRNGAIAGDHNRPLDAELSVNSVVSFSANVSESGKLKHTAELLIRNGTDAVQGRNDLRKSNLGVLGGNKRGGGPAVASPGNKTVLLKNFLERSHLGGLFQKKTHGGAQAASGLVNSVAAAGDRKLRTKTDVRFTLPEDNRGKFDMFHNDETIAQKPSEVNPATLPRRSEARHKEGGQVRAGIAGSLTLEARREIVQKVTGFTSTFELRPSTSAPAAPRSEVRMEIGRSERLDQESRIWPSFSRMISPFIFSAGTALKNFWKAAVISSAYGGWMRIWIILNFVVGKIEGLAKSLLRVIRILPSFFARFAISRSAEEGTTRTASWPDKLRNFRSLIGTSSSIRNFMPSGVSGIFQKAGILDSWQPLPRSAAPHGYDQASNWGNNVNTETQK